VGDILVEHRVDRLAGWDLALNGVEKADEFAVAVVLYTSANHCSDVHAERGEHSGGAVALVVVRQGLAAPGSIGSPGWVRSRAWIWFFSSSERTTACVGGST